MGAVFIVIIEPKVKVDLQLVDRAVELLSERHAVELIEQGLVEPLDDAVGLRALGLGARVIDVFDREVERKWGAEATLR